MNIESVEVFQRAFISEVNRSLERGGSSLRVSSRGSNYDKDIFHPDTTAGYSTIQAHFKVECNDPYLEIKPSSKFYTLIEAEGKKLFKGSPEYIGKERLKFSFVIKTVILPAH